MKHPLKAIEQMLHNLNKVVTVIQKDIRDQGYLYQVLTPYYEGLSNKTVAERNSNQCEVLVASIGKKATVKYPVINPSTNLKLFEKECIVDLSGNPPYGSCQFA